ncbi:MAG TPA: AI-2E family transporter [Candidatus Paceibacterota bacterium]
MMGRGMNITITAGTIIKAVLIIALAWLLFVLRGTVLIVLTAIVIASAIEPAVIGLMKRKVPRILAVIAVYLVLFAVFFSIFYFFLPSVFNDLAEFVGAMPVYIDSLAQAGIISHYAEVVGGPSGGEAISSANILEGIRSTLGFDLIFSNTFAAIAAVFGGVFSFILIIIFSFYFAVVETGVDDFLRVITPKSHQSYVLGLWRRSQHKIGLWMQGQLLLAVIMGVLVYLGLTILGVPHALVLAVIAACFEIIPVFGPALAAVPAVAIAFAAGGPLLGLLTVGMYVIAQQFENHLIYPLVVTRVVGVPPLLVILALIVGAELAGFLGVILSVPIAATIRELARDHESGRLREHASE